MITKVRGQGDVQLRAFALSDMLRWGYSGLRNFTPQASESNVRGIPAINRAARLRAEALAGLKLCIWRGDGVERERITDGRTWQVSLFRDAPNEDQDRFRFWEIVGESLAYRNNAYIWKSIDPVSRRPVELYALHPDQVVPDDTEDGWRVTVMPGYVDPTGQGKAVYRVDDRTVLHIRGFGDGGKRVAPTLIQNYQEALETTLARMRHETRVWRKGATTQVALKFPPGVSKDQADPWKEAWRAENAGVEGETTPVIGMGADIVPIGMTQADAAYVDMAKLNVHDASRIMGVPANLLGAQTERPVPNLEQDFTLWLRTGLGPELARIESALCADPQLFGPNSSVWPGFDTEGFVRGDVATEAQVLVQLVQSGILTVDEARAVRGLEELPGGAGAIPQITPVGGAPNPNLQQSNPDQSNENGGDSYE